MNPPAAQWVVNTQKLSSLLQALSSHLQDWGENHLHPHGLDHSPWRHLARIDKLPNSKNLAILLVQGLLKLWMPLHNVTDLSSRLLENHLTAGQIRRLGPSSSAGVSTHCSPWPQLVSIWKFLKEFLKDLQRSSQKIKMISRQFAASVGSTQPFQI